MRMKMRWVASVLVVLLMAAGSSPGASGQAQDRIIFNDQSLFLSGGNVAWINFARDIGPGPTELDTFDGMFAGVHEAGGNAMRIWLHTTGAVTPEWNGSTVVGPGVGAIEDLRDILDTAWQNEVGLVLCLWSFDMLQEQQGAAVNARAYDLLTTPSLIQEYIDNALVPMVEELADHPAVISWEIFNEPEGMTTQFGWTATRVGMSDIQRFVNMTAGAIHRTNSDALVTNGTWSMQVLTDVPTEPLLGKTDRPVDEIVDGVRREFSLRHGYDHDREQIVRYVEQLQTGQAQGFNYYSDERLVAAGGDELGTLDFYQVHYYTHFSTAQSPFHNPRSHWQLDKPIMVGEFFLPESTFGVPYGDLYETLFLTGYAGALGWQWFDWATGRVPEQVNWPRALENMQTIATRFPGAVEIDAGLVIVSFEADPPGIEDGQASTLTWSVSGAASVTLNGNPVEASGSLEVTPSTTTDYTLVAVDDEAEELSRTVTVEVLDPSEVNRALSGPAVASTFETCCGDELTADLAFDGDGDTRWSSEWEEGFADADPDDEWIHVDLGAAYDIDSVLLTWEAAFGSAYEIEVSFDARFWTTVFEETSGDGGVDEILFDDPPSGRYVRMRGIDRATEFGYSLWEFEVYGLPAARQPPTVELTSPADGRIVPAGTSLPLTVDYNDTDGVVELMDYYDGAAQIWSTASAPFEASLLNVTPGIHEIAAVATDDDGLSVASRSRTVFALDTSGFARYEAEDAVYSGSVTEGSAGGASGGAYLDMTDTGTITWDVTVARSGEYVLTIRHNLSYDVPKHQMLSVNGEEIGEIRFNGAGGAWTERGVVVYLDGGSNTVTIGDIWGWMYLDYLGVSSEPVNVGVVDDLAVPATARLQQNYPNPFNPQTRIGFELRESGPVRLQVFDATGRLVATLVDDVRPAGEYAATFDASGLASGVYAYRLEAAGRTFTRKMVLMR